MDFRRCDVHALAAVLAVGSTFTLLHGETFVLHPDDGSSSRVQDAIDAAENGDVILLTSGTWTWGVDYGQLDFQGKAITLEGESDGSTIVSLALKPESTPAILIQSGESESTRIRNLEFQGMAENTGNVLWIADSHPAIESCRFHGLEGFEQPAIHVQDGGLVLDDCDFTENIMGEPAIVSVLNSMFIMSETTFTDCGRYNSVIAHDSMVDIHDSRFERTEFGLRTREPALELVDCCGSIIDNAFQGLKVEPWYWESAAIDVYRSDADENAFCLSVANCTFDDLESTNVAPGISSSVPMVVASCDFSRCDCNGFSGGAVDFYRGGVAADCTFTDCSSSRGGGLSTTGDTVVWGCTFIENDSLRGGGVHAAKDRLILLGCDFEGNDAQLGGAVWTSLNAREAGGIEYPVSIYGCRFTDNRSFEAGGAVFFGDEIEKVLVDGCEFSNNLDHNGKAEAFGHPDEEDDWERYDVVVRDSLFCPHLNTSRRYMVDAGGNLIDIRCPGEQTDSILLSVTGRPLMWVWNDFLGWIRQQALKSDIHLYDPSTGGMKLYFQAGPEWRGDPKIDAFARLDRRTLLMSFTGNGEPDDLEDAPENPVNGSDILMFHATEFGNRCSGSWSFYFDGSDVGLSGSRGNIDALAIEPDGSLLISVQGAIDLDGIGRVEDADVLRFRPISLGSNTQGTWERVFGTDYSRFTGQGENIDALAIQGINEGSMTFLFSSTGKFTVDGLTADDEDVLGFNWYPDLEEAPINGSLFLYYDGLDNLLFSAPKADISALDWVGDW